MTARQTGCPRRKYLVFANVSIRATDIEDAREYIESTEWITDLSGRQPNVVPIFHALRTGYISCCTVLGLVPTIPNQGDDIHLTSVLFSGTVVLEGNAKSKSDFKGYIHSGFWFVNGRVKLHNFSRVYDPNSIDMDRYVL